MTAYLLSINTPCRAISRRDDARRDDARRVTLSIACGLALFLGAFSLLNLLREIFVDGFDANIWWIDMRSLPDSGGRAILLVFSMLMIGFGARPAMGSARRTATLAIVGLIALIVPWNVAVYYRLLVDGAIGSAWPVPFSLLIEGALGIILMAILRDTAREPRRRLDRVTLGTIAACLVGFPLMQIVCFGTTDYRRQADAIVVLGARAHADGALSIPLADRVRKGVELYRCGYAEKLIFSGGPGDGDIHETEAMRARAIRMGVPASAIILDRDGLNTRATARNTVRLFREQGIHRVMVVSNFYHLPRIKMTYQQEGRQVYTVPADDTVWSATPKQLVREILGLWAYYWS